MMSKQEKKRKVDFKCHDFKAEWCAGYSVIELDDKGVVSYSMTL